MFETFDHPDMNVSSAQRNVSTVPTQALTLLNNPFVLKSGRAARGSHQEGSARRSRRSRSISAISTRWRARPRGSRQSLALETVQVGRSLVDFTHVLLNLSEFLYMR